MKEEVLYTDKTDSGLIIVAYLILLIIPIKVFHILTMEDVILPSLLSLPPLTIILIVILIAPMLFSIIFCCLFSLSYYINYSIKITDIGIYYKNFRVNEFIAWKDIQCINIKQFVVPHRGVPHRLFSYPYSDILIITKNDRQKTPIIMRRSGMFKDIISNKAINKKHIIFTEDKKIKTPFSFEWCVVNSYKILRNSMIPILPFFCYALIKTRLL